MKIKKIIHIITVILLLYNYLYAQNPKIADSLRNQIGKQNNTKELIKIYNKISWNLKNSNFDSSMHYAIKAKELSEKEGYKSGLAEALKNIGNIHNKKGQNILATSYYEKAYQIYNQINDTIGKASTLNNLGNMASNKADFLKAADYYINAIKLYKQKNDSNGTCGCFLNLGTVYNRMQKYDKALHYMQEATEISLMMKKNAILASCYMNIGAIYSNLKENDKSISYFKKALKLKIKLDDKLSVSSIYSNIGRVFMDIKMPDSALLYFNKSLEIKKQLNDFKDYAPIFISYAELFISMENNNKALEYLKQAEIFIPKTKSYYLMPSLFKMYSEIYTKKQDYKTANFYLKKQIQYSDSLNDNKIELKISELEKQYEIEKRELQIASLKSENALKNLQVEKKKQQIWLWSIICILFIIIAISSQIAFQNNKRKNRILQQQNGEIQKQHDFIAHQKEIITKELSETVFKSEILERENLQYKLEALKNQLNPHFMFNTFSTLISLISDDQKLAEQYARNLSSMYRYILTKNDIELTTVQDELDFVEAYMFMVSIRFNHRVRLHNNIEDKHKASSMPSFTLQLLVENAVKHNIISNKLPLNVYLESIENKICVRNNFQPKKTSEISTGIGLNNIKARYKYLSEDFIEIISTENEFIVKLPVIQNHKNGTNNKQHDENSNS